VDSVSSNGVGGKVSYDYNVLGQRISRKEISGKTTNTEYYVHDGVNVAADLDSDKNLIRSYSYAPGYDNIISMTSYGDNETNTYFYIRNHNNSVVALIDECGSVAEFYQYSAYGEVTVFDTNGDELDDSALGNRYCFQSREIDYTTGLYNFRASWYDAETGRWLSKDPIGISGGLNQYVFCGNNPVMFVDPEGTEVYVFYTDFPHLGIIISDPTGKFKYIKYDFAAKSGVAAIFFSKGVISKNEMSYLSKKSYTEIFELTGITDEQECELYKILEEENNNQERHYNGLFYNCSTFVIDMLYECGYLSEKDHNYLRGQFQHPIVPFITIDFMESMRLI